MNINLDEVVALAKRICFEIETVVSQTNHGIDLEEEWAQKGPRALVRFLVEPVGNEDYGVRKTVLEQNASRLRQWLTQDENEYQRRHPHHVNEIGGSVPARRVKLYKNCDNFVRLCQEDVRSVEALYELAAMDPAEATVAIEAPVVSLVHNEGDSQVADQIAAKRRTHFAASKPKM